MRLVEPSYTMKVRYVSGAGNEMDNFVFTSTVPVEEYSWGMIKNIYKE